MTARPFRDLCPEADSRDAMTEEEFWDHVSANLQSEPLPWDDLDGAPDLDLVAPAGPCPVCGGFGACSYDTEGRALIHAVSDEEDD